MAKRRLPQTKAPGRSCGQCNECCSAMGVPELQKPAWTPCSHVVDHKCSCYTSRPTSCQEYRCLWLQEAIDGPSRPDRVGVIFDRTDSTKGLEERTGLHVITARVTRETEEGLAIIDRLSRQFLVIIMYGADRRRIVGPPQAEVAIRAILASQ